MPMIKVLFVCLGNICRSPMAEAVFAQLVREAGLENQIEIDSAGTGSYHIGQPAHRGTQRILAQNKVPYDGRARQILDRDLQQFDYVVAMDRQNLLDINALPTGRAKIVLLLDYATNCRECEVPDPYYTGDFAGVYDMVRQGCAGLLAAIRKERGI